MSNDNFYSRNRTNETGGVFAKLLLLVFLAIGLTVGSFFVFPAFWRERLADYLLGDETVEAPKTDPDSAQSARDKLDALKNRVKRLEVLPADAPDSITLTKLEIDSYIAKACDELDKVEIPEGTGVDPEEAKRAGCDIVHAMDSLQIELREDSFVVLGNIDLKMVAGLVEENAEYTIPEEFRRRVGFSGEYRLVTKDRTVDFEMQDLVLGQTSLKDSLLAPLLEEMREKIDEFVKSKIQSAIGSEFKRTSDTGMSFKLPDEIENIKVSPDGIKIDYAKRP